MQKIAIISFFCKFFQENNFESVFGCIFSKNHYNKKI